MVKSHCHFLMALHGIYLIHLISLSPSHFEMSPYIIFGLCYIFKLKHSIICFNMFDFLVFSAVEANSLSQLNCGNLPTTLDQLSFNLSVTHNFRYKTCLHLCGHFHLNGYLNFLRSKSFS